MVREAMSRFVLCTGTTATDNSDGDITDRMTISLQYNRHKYADNGLSEAGFYGPHMMTQHTGDWVFEYRVADSSGNEALARKAIRIIGTSVCFL